MDSIRVAGISFTNYGIYLVEVNLFLQCVVATMSIVYLSYKIIKIKKES